MNQQAYETEADKRLQELRERNEQRLKEAKDKLGTKYLLHPANHVTRRPEVVLR